MEKIALICYHKNASSLYPASWIEAYRNSILGQTVSADVFEFNYGNDGYRIFPDSIFINSLSPNFVEVMNFLLNHCFLSMGYDYVFNSNCDDVFALDRIEKQLVPLRAGFDIVSSNFALTDADGKEYKRHKFDSLDIPSEILRGHNIIGHPAVAYSKKFWIDGHRYNSSEIPYEDIRLWQRSVGSHKFIILPDCLLFHRIHGNSVCKSNNR